jgi:ubiquinone/menaquinone biosynthesis C-methylase UbiE
MTTGKAGMFNCVDINTVRSYWDGRPCNIRNSDQEVGSKAYFDDVEERKYFVEPHIPPFADFQRWQGKKVLEIGCGIGTDTMNFARSGARVTAVDLSEESLKIAKLRARVLGLENIRFYQANAEELTSTVPVERYDLVYSFGVIHHTPHPEKALKQIRRYMDADSSLKIMVYHRHSWKVFWILATYGKGALHKIDNLIAKYSEAQTGCPVTYAYTPETVKPLLKGFAITDTRIDHIFPYAIAAYKRYRYEKTWYFKWIPQWLFHWMEKRWGWHLCVTATLDGKSSP